MSKPEKQHFIPVSYLKNFAVESDGKYFVEIKHKDSDEIKKAGIRDICRVKNLYTIPLVDGDEKYKLERMYGTHVDSVYPEVYKMLVDPNKIYITDEEKEKIIVTCLSLYFRTPKFLDSNTRVLNSVFEYALKNCVDAYGFVKYKFKDFDLNFHVNDVEATKAHYKTIEKIKFLKDHIEQWHEFVKFKIKAAISVDKTDDVDLITCDNPVSIYDHTGRLNNLFADGNIIKLPLDKKHSLTIHPEIENNALSNKILRTERDSMTAWIMNNDVQLNSTDILIGSEGSIQRHFSDHAKLNGIPPQEIENIISNKMREISDTQEITSLLEKGISDSLVNKAIEIRDNLLYKDNKQMQKLAVIVIFKAKQAGFLIPEKKMNPTF